MCCWGNRNVLLLCRRNQQYTHLIASAGRWRDACAPAQLFVSRMSKLFVPRNNRFYSFLNSSKHFWVFWISSFQSTQSSMTAGEMSLSACSAWAFSLVQECLGEKVSAPNWTQFHSGCQRWSTDDFMWLGGDRQEFKLKSWQKVDEMSAWSISASSSSWWTPFSVVIKATNLPHFYFGIYVLVICRY